jgi:hypothetical protein
VVPERTPGWVTGINDFEARLATGVLFTSPQVVDSLDPLRVRNGIRDASGSPGLVTLGANKVTVNAFQAVIQDSARPALGPYVVTLDAPKDLALTASDLALGRIDLVIAEIDATVDPGFTVHVVQGAASGTPQVPTVTNPLHIKLAQIQIPAAAATPTLTDLRQFTAALGGILPVRGSGDLPGLAGASSRFIYRLDTKQLQVVIGGQWVAYRPPRGSVDTWHEVAFAANWTNYNTSTGTYNTVAYTITEDGWVRLRGLAKATAAVAAGSNIYTLPADYRPRRQQLLIVSSANGAIRVDIKTSGTVTVSPALQINDWVSLDNIAFAAANTYTT